MSGVESRVSATENSITNKVWSTDITTAIDNYDGTTVEAVRDRVTQTETDIDGITTTIRSVETWVGYDADGTESERLIERFNTTEETVDGHEQIIGSYDVTTSGTISSRLSTIEQTESNITLQVEYLESGA